MVETLARAVEKLDALAELLVDRLADEGAQLRVGRVGNGDRRARRAVCGALEAMYRSALAIVDAAELVAAAQRPVHRKGADAENALQFVEQLERIAARPVHLVHEREQRNAALATDGEQLLRLRLDAFGGVDQHHRAVGGEQRAIGILAEVLVARRIEQVDRVIREYGNWSTVEVIEMPRSRSSAIQSLVACR